MDGKKDFFISYTTNDQKWATWIAATLEGANYSTIIQAWDFKPGTNFVANMHNALINSERFIAVLSPDYFESLYCQDEWTAAFTKDKKLEHALFIPIRIADFKPEGLFAPIVYIDLFGADDMAEAAKRLLNGVDLKIPRISGFPGTKKPMKHYQLPFNNLHKNQLHRNPFFTGREGILEKLHKTFQKENLAALSQTVTGLGGVGKTQTALEYAYRYGHLYDVVWWVHADNTQTIFKDYLDFARTKKLIDENVIDQQVIIDAVCGWMDIQDNWLFVYDNADDDKSILEYLPASSRGNILITSRFKDFRRIGEAIQIDVYEPEEAIEFLTKVTKIDDNDGAGKLAKTLGYLPLALGQAAAYISATVINYVLYLERFDKHRLKLFTEHQPLDYHSTVALTWQISIDKIESESAKQLLNLLSFFAPDNIDSLLFVENSDLLPEPLASEITDELAYDRLVTELSRYSLIKVYDNGVLSIHRLLQEVIRQSIDRLKWLDYCITLIIELFRFNRYNSETWNKLNSLYPHAISISHIADLSKIDAKSTAWLYHELAAWAEQVGMFNEALELYMKSSTQSETAYGLVDKNTAAVYNNIANIHYETSNYSESQEWYFKALAIYEIVLGLEHPETAATYNNIANVFRAQGDYEKALEWAFKDLSIIEKALGLEHTETATSYNNVAGIYHEMGNYESALEWYNKALPIIENVLGPRHPHTATTYNNIAGIYLLQGYYHKALELFLKSLDIREGLLGANHPDVAQSCNNIAGVYIRIKEYPKAFEWYKKALYILEGALGVEHLYTATTYNNIAGVYHSQNDYYNALKWYIKALKIFLKNEMFEHPNTKSIFESIYSSYRASDLPEAEFKQWLTDKLKEEA